MEGLTGRCGRVGWSGGASALYSQKPQLRAPLSLLLPGLGLPPPGREQTENSPHQAPGQSFLSCRSPAEGLVGCVHHCFWRLSQRTGIHGRVPGSKLACVLASLGQARLGQISCSPEESTGPCLSPFPITWPCWGSRVLGLPPHPALG